MAEWFKATVLKIVNVIVREFESLCLRLKYKNIIMNNYKLEQKINKFLLNKNSIKDYTINGLQIEGKKNIKNIITCVTINKQIIKQINNKLDAIIAHHGIIINNNFSIKGIQRKYIYKILKKNINIYTWHLPLDIHNKIGNNVELAKKFNITIKKLPKLNFPVLIGKIKKNNLIQNIKKKIKNFNYIKSKNKNIYKIGICSGSGENFLEKSILVYKIDTYITGEISEKTIYLSKEYKINIIILGHHVSEIWGIKKLSLWIKKKFNLNIKFLNIPKYINNVSIYNKELNI